MDVQNLDCSAKFICKSKVDYRFIDMDQNPQPYLTPGGKGEVPACVKVIMKLWSINQIRKYPSS